ncbi:hypothetical protein THIOKS11090005 [Thiocapsa sp. KS1]|nr:hypothetical protein THIOKS11090005 [Thiocapsa sp. KS1]
MSRLLQPAGADNGGVAGVTEFIDTHREIRGTFRSCIDRILRTTLRVFGDRKKHRRIWAWTYAGDATALG